MISEHQGPKRKIFINYRRSDHPDFVERVRDWFLLRYGRDSVFMDFDTIPPFTRFDIFIRKQIQECDVLVAIIGPQWLDMLRERLANPDEEDFVQTEIKLALEEGKLIAPICIKGAQPPRAALLPPELRPMLAYHVAHLNSGRSFLENIEPILDAVERQLVELDGLRVVNQDIHRVEEGRFNMRKAITSFQVAEERRDWETALNWLTRIRQSGYMPRFYPIDDYEREIREAIVREERERDYEIIRMMAARADTGRENPSRVLAALQTLWETQPGYDPDDLAARMRHILDDVDYLHQPSAADDFDIEEALALQRKIYARTPIQNFNSAILDGLDDIDMAEADALFDPDNLEPVSLQFSADKSLDYDEALKRGLISDE